MTFFALIKQVGFFYAAMSLAFVLPAWSSPENIATRSATSMLAAKVLIGLTLIVILILSFAWLAKKLGYVNLGAQHCQMSVLGSLPLGTREKAVMVQIAGRMILLGVSPGSVTTLYTFSDQEQQAALETMQGGKSAPQASSLSQNFSQVLKSLAANRRGEK